MKVHIYKGPMDKIPLNAIPFYKTDTMEVYKDVAMTYDRKKISVEDWFDLDDIRQITEITDDVELADELLWGIEYVNECRSAIENGMLYFIPFKEGTERHILIKAKEKDGGVIVYSTEIMGSVNNYSLKAYFKSMNKMFKEAGYEYVSYLFDVAHSLKPDINREDYDIVYRFGATDDYMGYRCYVKNLKKEKEEK